MARKFVEQEIMPLEPDYLKSPHAGYGLQPITNLKKAFPKETTDRLFKMAKETGLWYLMVPESHGGMKLSMLAQMVMVEQFMYTAVPFPFVNVPNILYNCEGEQVDKYLTPTIEGERFIASRKPNRRPAQIPAA